jgi:predicted DNA-binding transcriptional regulator AlpA
VGTTVERLGLARNRTRREALCHLRDCLAMESNVTISFLLASCDFAVGLLTGPAPNRSVSAVNRGQRDRRLVRPSPATELREAFAEYARIAGRRWNARITSLPKPAAQASPQSCAAVRIDLDADDACALASLVSAAAREATAQTVARSSAGLLGTVAVARLTGYAPSTIRAWLARSLPRDNPFPRPEKDLSRNHWQLSAISAWEERQALLAAQQRKKAPKRRRP